MKMWFAGWALLLGGCVVLAVSGEWWAWLVAVPSFLLGLTLLLGFEDERPRMDVRAWAWRRRQRRAPRPFSFQSLAADQDELNEIRRQQREVSDRLRRQRRGGW